MVGCRYKLRQRRRFPDVGPTNRSLRRSQRADAALAAVLAMLPRAAAIGDKVKFTRIDIPPTTSRSGDDELFAAEAMTLEALAHAPTLITGAVLTPTVAGTVMRVHPDVLVAQPDGSYCPVIISQHRVAEPARKSTLPVVGTSRLGLATAVTGHYRLRHHPIDGYRIALADLGLAEVGLSSGTAGCVGQDRSRVFFVDACHYHRPLAKAVAQKAQLSPHRIKQCAGCRFWFDCEKQLKDSDDISLFLPGDKARALKDKGIDTVSALAGLSGQTAALARAYQAGIPVVRKKTFTPPVLHDVELDIDVESFLDRGAYLWGVFDGTTYHSYTTWDGLGGDAEAGAFADFFHHIRSTVAAARQAGQTVAVHCYAAGGENHWLLSCARRFGGYESPGGNIAPTEREVREFISSGVWIDVFATVKNNLFGPFGLGLKHVAPVAGFTWPDDDIDGEVSLHYYRIARGFVTDGEVCATRARQILLDYNEGDTRATRAVRHWLAAGAADTPSITAL
nr:ribonuclease H-like domain-containing protein [Corynebacterium mendelii]